MVHRCVCMSNAMQLAHDIEVKEEIVISYVLCINLFAASIPTALDSLPC